MVRKRFTRVRPGHDRVTKAIKQARISETIELLVRGHSTHEICNTMAPRWGCKPGTVRHYVKQAHRVLAKSNEITRAAELTKAIRRFNYVYRNSFDNKTKLAAATKICEVLKLGELGKIDLNVTGKVEHEHSVTPEQAQTIFGILEGAGAFESPTTPAQAD